MQTILVPTDFSNAAESALKTAKNIAKKTHAKIHLANFFTLPMADYSYPEINMPAEILKEIKDGIQIEMDKLLNELKTEGFDVEATIEMGFPTEEIVAICEKLQPDLIIMGTTGSSGIVNKLIGSNAEHVMQKVTQPIILVPQNYILEDIDNVVYLAELKEDDTPVLEKLFDFADSLNASNIRLLNVNTGFFYEPIDEQLMIKLDNTFGLERIKLETIDGADLKEGVDNYLKKHLVDLVVMSTHKKTLLERIFVSSNTDKMALHNKIPLLIYHKD